MQKICTFIICPPFKDRWLAHSLAILVIFMHQQIFPNNFAISFEKNRQKSIGVNLAQSFLANICES